MLVICDNYTINIIFSSKYRWGSNFRSTWLDLVVSIARYMVTCHLYIYIGSIPRYVIVSPVRSTYGGYYGLVVVPPPRPQTLHRSHDNIKHPYRIATIFYMYIDIGERMPGKQDGPIRIIYGPPRPPRITQNAIFFFTLGPIYEKLVIFYIFFIKVSAL